MSLILEALRKSEAERRRGQTPDLLTEALPVAPAARRAAPKWSVLLPVSGAALITLLLVVWWLRPSAEAVPNESAVTEPAAVVTVEAAPAAPVVSAKSPTSLSPPVTSSRTPAAAPLPSTSAAPARALPDPAPSAATAQPAEVRTAPVSAPTAKPAPPTPEQVASLEPIAPPPAPASAPVFASPDAPMRLADLSAEERQALPALKVSMHMWAPEAGNRFAIIDGTRVNEGDRLGEAMIDAIQPDSVMLSWRGRQIRLPIR